ncbi:MAG: carboxypeptidase regulatory-like domain-containing protein [Gemmatimonadales bacterium]
MPHLVRLGVLFFALPVLGPLQTSPLAGQATTVVLRGTVRDTAGRVPQEGQVEIHSRETGLSRQARVEPDGQYRVLGLPAGIYDITVRAIGYRAQRREAVELILGLQAIHNFVLEEGALELEPIVVSADRPFEIDRMDVSTAVLQEEIEKLPLNSRNLLNIAAVAPGIRTYAQEGNRSGPAAGALPMTEPRYGNLYVDGIEWKGMYVGQVVGNPNNGSMIPQEAVREFRVYLNSYDAEYSRGASYVVSAVTRRGGNHLEGSLFGYFQNKGLVAKGSFQDTEPDYSRYQIGGNLRGPLVRNKLFFALSYEGQLTDNFIDVTPGRPAVNPGIWDQYAGTFAAPNRHHTGLLRLTAPLGSHTLDALAATRRIRSETAFGTLLDNRMLTHDAGVLGDSRVNSIQLRDTYASRSLVNELSLHLLDLRNDQSLLVPGPTFLYPGIQIGRANQPFLNEERHLRLINKTSYSLGSGAGRHLIKGGLELSRIRLKVHRPSNSEGSFRFPTDTSTQPDLGQVALGFQDPSSTREGQAIIQGWLVGAYLQDQWQPVSSLTLTAGLRYDADIDVLNQQLITPWATDTTLQRAFGEEFLNTGDRKNDLDNISPRLAISWDVFGSAQTFLRGGYGIMYDRVPLFGTFNEAISVGWRTYSFANPGTTDPEELRRRVLNGANTTAQNITLLKDRLETPASHQWSVGAGHQLTDRLAINLDYVNQRVTHAPVTVTENLPHPVTRARPITTRFGNISVWNDFGDARFDALLLSITYNQRPTRFNLGYTLGWADSEFGDFTTNDYPDSAAYNLQRSENDERHRFVLSGFTELPLRLELSGIAIMASPRPFLVTVGSDVNQNGSASDDWPGGMRTSRRDGWSYWYRTIDLRLGKTFLMPHGRLTVTTEMFNVLSWANHSEYQATENLLAYGEPVGDYARRQAQLGLRYEF